MNRDKVPDIRENRLLDQVPGIVEMEPEQQLALLNRIAISARDDDYRVALIQLYGHVIKEKRQKEAWESGDKKIIYRESELVCVTRANAVLMVWAKTMGISNDNIRDARKSIFNILNRNITTEIMASAEAIMPDDHDELGKKIKETVAAFTSRYASCSALSIAIHSVIGKQHGPKKPVVEPESVELSDLDNEDIYRNLRVD